MKQIKERNLNKNNDTPLHIAAVKDSDEMVELLISKNAYFNPIDINCNNLKILFLIKRVNN